MDGSTAVVNRMRLMDDFNESPRTFAFLLTTKVGGIGVNLTGANRCNLRELDFAAPQAPCLRKPAALVLWKASGRADISGTNRSKVVCDKQR